MSTPITTDANITYETLGSQFNVSSFSYQPAQPVSYYAPNPYTFQRIDLDIQATESPILSPAPVSYS